MYGISQNPDTKDYVMILQSGFCKKCGEQYIDKSYSELEWCKTCQINNLKANFTNWTSGNDKINDFIQKMQSNITSRFNEIFEWIPYDQFSNIKEVDKGGFDKIYT